MNYDYTQKRDEKEINIYFYCTGRVFGHPKDSCDCPETSKEAGFLGNRNGFRCVLERCWKMLGILGRSRDRLVCIRKAVWEVLWDLQGSVTSWACTRESLDKHLASHRRHSDLDA